MKLLIKINKKIVIRILVSPPLIFIPRITVNSFSIISRSFFIVDARGLLIVQNLLDSINITSVNAIQLIENTELLDGSKIENKLVIIL